MKKYRIYYISIVLLIIMFGLMFWLKYNLPYLKIKGIYESKINIGEKIINTKLTLNLNKSFTYENDNISYSGSYEIKDNEIILNYSLNTIEDEYNYIDKIYMNNNKLCKDSECNNYYLKNKITQIKLNDFRKINYINYNEYLNLFNNNDNNIVIVSTENCTFCKKYIDNLNEINNYLNTNIHIINIDENEELKKEYKQYPTTLIINNNKITYSFIGIQDFNSLYNYFKKNNFNVLY